MLARSIKKLLCPLLCLVLVSGPRSLAHRSDDDPRNGADRVHRYGAELARE